MPKTQLTLMPPLPRFAPVALDDSSRLGFRQLRRPTRLPTLQTRTTLGRYLDRLIWLFGGR